LIKLCETKKIIIFGAGHGLGLGFVKAALNLTRANVIAVYHNESRASDLLEVTNGHLEIIQMDPFDVVALKEFSFKYKDIDLLINTIGFLHNDDIKPEKSLRDIDVEKLLYSYKINTTLTPLLMKHFKNRMSDNSAYLVLGAKVGSIGDNEIGGWYGYRGSKAALNMMVKNIDIELKRSNRNIRMLCFHPGTTETKLSRPYLAGVKHKIWEVDAAGENLFKLIEVVYPEKDLFYFWDGSVIPW
jgi:NAD(P)-dependent dehydrogenase (short-subunit alcohol dehydrogenase family)